MIRQGRIFQKDIFCNPRPLFRTLEPRHRSDITDVLSVHYLKQVGSIRRIQQSKANEINSQNFLIHGLKGKFVLKKSAYGSGLLKKSQPLLKALKRNRIRFPETVLSDDRNLSVRYGGVTWSLSKFVDGNYYGGGMSDFAPLINAEVKLFEALRGSKRFDRGFAKRTYFTAGESRTLAWYAKSRSKIKNRRFRALVNQAWPIIEEVAVDLRRGWKRIKKKPLSLCHIDLHPHNVLMRGNRVTFLDADSIQWGSAQVCLGYSVFKHARNLVIKNALRSKVKKMEAIRSRLVSQLKRSKQFKQVTLSDLCFGAKLELMKRALYILQDYKASESLAWESFLAGHVRGMREADFIFGAKGD